MRYRRLLLTAAALATVSVAATAPGQEAPPTYFAASFPGWVERVAAGADGSVFGTGVTRIDDLPGTIVPPIHLDVWRHLFVSAWGADGGLRWTTYLPFYAGEGYPAARAVAESPDGSVWVACCVYGDGGWRDEDVGVAHLSADGSILSAVQFGGQSMDRPAGLVVTAGGDAIVAGSTWSLDFPTTLPSSWSGGDSAAFVARVGSDGTGVAWSRLLDTPGHVRATAVGSDGDGGILAAVAVSPTPINRDWYDDLTGTALLSELAVAHVSSDGAIVGTTALQHADGGAVLSLTACPDGSILAAGIANYAYGGGSPSGSDGYLMRVRPESGAVTALWKERSSWAPRFAVESSGDVLIATDPQFVNPQYYWTFPPAENISRILRLTPDLRETATLLDRDGLRSVEDLAVAADGAVCVAGHGLAVTFNPVVPQTDVNASLVARIPASGAAPAANLDAGRATRRTVRLSWTDGDPVAGYEVELRSGSVQSGDLRYEVVAHAPAGAHSVDVSGLAPGEANHLRLVSVFASGVRSAPRPVVVHPRPAKMSSLRARQTTRGIDLRWTPGFVATNVRLQLERRINQGPWVPVPPRTWALRHLNYAGGQVVDASPSWGAASVTYRIRAELIEGRGASAWTLSNTIAFPQTFVGFSGRRPRWSADLKR